jgi:hypothetical protein
LWDTLILFQNYAFKTAEGLRFHYIIKENEIFFTREEKPVTRPTVNLALERAMELQEKGIKITASEMRGCFGTGYLYPVFIRVGVICE